MGNVIQKPKVYQYSQSSAQPSKVESKRYESGIGKTLLSSGANLATGTIGSIIGAEISDRYNKKAEERMDKRNRQLILDTPSLTTEGRRRAGLNPYGDPILPGMSSQSSTDTSDVAPNSFYEAQQLTLQERIAVRQLENETLVAESQANLNDANADRARGVENRDSEMFDVRKQMEETQLYTQQEIERIKRVEADIAEATKSTEISYSKARFAKVCADILFVKEQTEKAITSQDVDVALVDYYQEMQNKLKAETAVLAVEENFKKASFLAYNGHWSKDGTEYFPGIWETMVQDNIFSAKERNVKIQQFEMTRHLLPEKMQKEIDKLVAEATSAIMNATSNETNADTNAYKAEYEETQGWVKIVVTGLLGVGGFLVGGPWGAAAGVATGAATL